MMSEHLLENSALQILIEKKKKHQPITLIHWLGSGPSYMISAGKQPDLKDVRSRVCKRLMTGLSNLAYGCGQQSALHLGLFTMT